MKKLKAKPMNPEAMAAITTWYEAFGNAPRCAAEYELLDLCRKAVFRRSLSPEAFFWLLMKCVPKEAAKEEVSKPS